MARRMQKEEWKTYGNVFDEFTKRNIFKLSSQDYFFELTSAYKMGKEANVFIASTKEEHDVMVKIYRLENCNFNKMNEYLSQDDRYENFKGQKRKIIFSWVQREYRNLMIAREVIRVPTPLVFKDNIVVVEMIGDDEPAQQLKDLDPTNPEEFLDVIIDNVRKLYKHGLVHGDLSAFNILNHDDEPIFIDFSQSTTTRTPSHIPLMRRDMVNVLAHFAKLGVERDIEEVLAYIAKD